MSLEPNAADDFLDEYLESISNLPSEISFNMSVLRDLDTQLQNIVESMRHNARSYAAIMKERRTAAGTPVVVGTDMAARGALIGYRRDYKAAMEAATRKVEESKRIAEQFSTHISRLDKALEKWDEGDPGQRRRRKTSASVASVYDSTPARRRTRQRSDEHSSGGLNKKKNSEDEALYCYCRQVSWGDMVGCDNENCPIEWFHYACVGLVNPPKGKWYCPQCTAAGFGRTSPASSGLGHRRRGSSHSLDSIFEDDDEDLKPDLDDEASIGSMDADNASEEEEEPLSNRNSAAPRRKKRKIKEEGFDT
ncbi:hypothetical protein BC832DRAFT_592220 [Gaertneriomyces semiglobifer]|nr:hypothetical protein BC832DRAFT_592220 [Gaertneriomyces semiglobifer]